MARLIWVGVGAVGGIYAYRKGEQAVDAVRRQGVAATVQIVAVSAVHALTAARSAPGGLDSAVVVPAGRPTGIRVGRFRISRADEATTHLQPAGIMDTGVITDAAPGRTGVPKRRKAH